MTGTVIETYGRLTPYRRPTGAVAEAHARLTRARLGAVAEAHARLTRARLGTAGPRRMHD